MQLKMKPSLLIIIPLFLALGACQKNNQFYAVPLTQLSDVEYPDDPYLELRHPLYNKYNFHTITLAAKNDSLFDITLSSEEHADKITLASIWLKEFLPMVCHKARANDYHTYLGIINQEWNRNQVSFDQSEFQITGVNSNHIKRVDIAQNCLSAGLWEIILFSEHENNLIPIHHSWFNFPEELYLQLFEKYNALPYEKYNPALENWVTPESKVIHLEQLRSVLTEKEAVWSNHNNKDYPLTGERKRKYKNILFPKNTTTIQHFLTDSTRFATFGPPGIYNTKAPRKTQLSRLANPQKIMWRHLHSIGKDTLIEIEISYQNNTPEKNTKLIISGIRLSELPTLDITAVDKGWQNSMGFGNHPFYETYKHTQSHPVETSPYFSVLTDEDYKWLDSHEVGIDGSLLHWDKDKIGLLHIWVLSFERHCFVGHYTLQGLR
jgi:hypothetical protein